MITRDIQRCLAADDDALLHAVLHAEGWVRRDGLLTPKAYHVIDCHVWSLVDSPLAPPRPQPCGWNWTSIVGSSRTGRQMIVRYLREAVRHHILWTENRWESN